MLNEQSPIYQQIAEQIKDDILSGVLGEDTAVMSTNQYASYYQINPATAAKGFHLLIDEGILYKRRGIGMFVTPGAREILRTRRRERFFSEVVEAMLREADRLGIATEEITRHIENHNGALARRAEETR